MSPQPRRLFSILLLTLSLVAASSVPVEQPPSFLTMWGEIGTDESQFNTPSGLALDATRNVYVADTENHRIQRFDRNGAFLRMWGWGVDTGVLTFQICTSNCQAGIAGMNDGGFTRPHDVAIDASGNVYVSDTFNHRIQKFDSNGAFLAKWGTVGETIAKFTQPEGVTVDAYSNVYVADKGNNRIIIQSSDGTSPRTWGWGVLDGSVEFQICAFPLVCRIGLPGSGDGQFTGPGDIVVDSSGNVYVADSSNQRIQKFDSSGTFLTKWGTSGSGPGQFKGPWGVTVDVLGNVYVADSGNHRIQKFDSTGAFLTEWGREGSSAGRFSYPHRVAVDAAAGVYVADKLNHRIQKFGLSWLDFFIGEPEL